MSCVQYLSSQASDICHHHLQKVDPPSKGGLVHKEVMGRQMVVGHTPHFRGRCSGLVSNSLPTALTFHPDTGFVDEQDPLGKVNTVTLWFNTQALYQIKPLPPCCLRQ